MNPLNTVSVLPMPGRDAAAKSAQKKSYTSGIDAQGNGYLYDRSTNRMVYYGAPNQAWEQAGASLRNQGYNRVWEGDKRPAKENTPPPTDPRNPGGGYQAPAKVLDQAQLDAIDSQFGVYDSARDTNKNKARMKREAAEAEKRQEREREEGKYKGKKLSTLQEFGGAKTDTDINTRNTLENLLSSISVLGLGGQRALTRQILNAANTSNRKANATQATNSQNLDNAFNEFDVANKNDISKIADQHDYEVAETEREWAQNRQNALYKKADVYNAADKTGERETMMREGNSLNSVIANAAFMNPRYDGQARAMATPELADYTQDIAKYDTTAIGADGAAAPGDQTAGAGNLAVRAIAVNDKDLGIKKKTEGNLGYGV